MAETNPTCPTHEQLLGYKRKSLAPGEADQITAHLKGCRNCQKSLVSLVVSGVHSSKSSEETLDPDTMIAPGGARTSAPDLEEESRRGKKSSRPKPPAEYPFLEPPEDSNEFARLGFYSIKRVLGSGGMGVVFEAVDQRLGRTVALKVLRPELADESYVERFRQEARLAASLSDEHIVTIFEVGLTNNVPFMAMEFLHGETLDARLNRDSWLSVEESLALLKQVAQG
ncbi:MAG: serine/threonine protein kinase, partial [Planctomycetes bacterium]|nr:serine/threonine protein kinase [Planctomycetota bacterium]